jgi:hypothetical protein
MSGARGTASQQQDRRNQDNARGAGNSAPGVGGGGGFGGGRGTMSQQQDRVNMANATRAGNMAPGVRGNEFDSRARNSRYQQNRIATRPATLGNIAQAISMGMPGPGMIAKGIAMGAGYDPYSGPVGHTTGYSYDGPNRFATNGSSLFPNPQQGIQGIQAAGQRPPVAQPQMPGMSQMQMPAAQLSVPGPSQYGVNLPSYGYFGKPPALQRPKSAIMGGI